MKKLPRPFTPAASILCVCLTLAFSSVAGAAGVRIVNCDQKIQSSKRGVCANGLSDDDFRLLAPGVSWFYNWHFESKQAPPGVAMEFLPMAWGNRPADVAGLQKYLSDAPKKPRVVLAINEPNLRGQAFITPEQTASLYRKIKDVADRYQIPTVGPNMALGSPENSSIKANDPIENRSITYTFMVPFLKAFLHYTENTAVPAMAFHSYGGPGELRWAVEMMHKEFNRPLWITEYAQWKADSVEDARKNLMQATDFLERSPYVAGYAWFKERANDNANISLLDPGSSALTPLGAAYVALPVHDADLYYRVPGRLQAENYVAQDQMEIHPTEDTNGFAFMGSEAANGWIEYNVQIDVPGPYMLNFRVGGAAGKLEISEGGQPVGQLQADGKPGWQNVAAPVTLAAGAQKLRVHCEQRNQAINWVEITHR